MSRRTARPSPGLDALRSAVAEQWQLDAGLTARDLSEPGRCPPSRVSGRGRLRSGAVPEPRGVSRMPVAPEDAPMESLVLVQRAQGGDTEAFAQLYDRYGDGVYRYVYLKVTSRQTAEDLTSETFTRALKRIDSFTDQGHDVGAWFTTIARNLVADHYRSARQRYESALGDDALAQAAPAVSGPEDEVLARLDSAALLRAVAELTPEQQDCIRLRFLQDRTVAETATVMGKKADAVKSLQYRAVCALGQRLRGAEL